METIDGTLLLAEYVTKRSEAAFREIVRRHMNLVYSAALRRVGGDVHLAKDVCQLTFSDLAQKAAKLPKDVVLAGWLHHHTCFRAATVVRGEVRRRLREQKALEMTRIAEEVSESCHDISHVVDDALDRLRPKYRNAIVLRFFEGKDFASVGRILGVTDDAAQKLVTRGIESLRSQFRRRRIVVSSGVLAVALGKQSVQAAPAGFAASTAAKSLAVAAASVSLPWWMRIVASHGLKVALTALGGLAVVLYFRGPSVAFSATEAAGPPPSDARHTTGGDELVKITETVKTTPASQPSAESQSFESPRPPMPHPVLESMAKAYSSLQSYHDTGLVRTVFVSPGSRRIRDIPFRTAFVRPNSFRFEFNERGGPFVIWSGGDEVKTWWPLHLPNHESVTTFSLAITGATGISGGASYTVPPLLLPTRVESQLPMTNFAVSRVSSDVIEGAECIKMEGTRTGFPMVVWVDAVTHMIRKIYREETSPTFRTEQTTTYDPIINRQIPEELLKFSPPEGK